MDRVANIYFHLQLQCVQKINKDITLDNVWITQEDFTGLKDAHLQFLEQCGLLENPINLLETEIHQIVTNYYFEFSTSQNELLLVSSQSISSLISGGNSSYSWVLVHALGLL